ncbi:MAG: MFS transporter [Lachnospiraceae bacterium]
MGEKGQEPKKLSGALKKFFGVADFSFTLTSNIDTFYASYFFTNIAQFSLGVITVMTTISAVVDAILSTMYGAFLNKIRPCRWGRYRSWLILTPWMIPFLYAMQFIRIGNGFAAVFFATFAMITSRIAWNLPYIANISMINIAGKTQEDRMALSSTRNVWTALASVVYSYLGPAVVAFFAANIGEKNAYAATALVFGALTVAAYYAHFVMFRGYEPTGEEEMAMMQANAGKEGSGQEPKVRALDAIRCNRHLVMLMGASMMKYVVLFLVNGMAIYYFKYVTRNEGMFATFIFIANVLGVAASFAARYIVAGIGAKYSVVLCYLGMGIAAILSFILYQNTIPVMILMGLLMFLMNVSNTCDPELYANCAAFSGQKLGYDVTGIVMGLLTVPLKIGIVARGILISACLALVHFDPGIDPAMASTGLQKGVCLGFMIIPAAAILLGAVILFAGYGLGTSGKKKTA